jgi:hypothetical protein
LFSEVCIVRRSSVDFVALGVFLSWFLLLSTPTLLEKCIIVWIQGQKGLDEVEKCRKEERRRELAGWVRVPF